MLQRLLLGLVIQAGELLHGLSYILLFFGLWAWLPFQKVLAWLQYPGRLSLTNYVLQSLICFVLFAGFNWYAQLLPSTLVLVAIAIYLGQALFSWLWLRRFSQGPLERLWRWLAAK